MSLNACIWARRALIWSGVKETGVCGETGYDWTAVAPAVRAFPLGAAAPFATGVGAAWPLTAGWSTPAWSCPKRTRGRDAAGQNEEGEASKGTYLIFAGSRRRSCKSWQAHLKFGGWHRWISGSLRARGARQTGRRIEGDNGGGVNERTEGNVAEGPHLDELLHALADGVGVGLGMAVGELLLGVRGERRIGGKIGGGHSGDDGEDATSRPRRDLVSKLQSDSSSTPTTSTRAPSHCPADKPFQAPIQQRHVASRVAPPRHASAAPTATHSGVSRLSPQLPPCQQNVQEYVAKTFRPYRETDRLRSRSIQSPCSSWTSRPRWERPAK